MVNGYLGITDDVENVSGCSEELCCQCAQSGHGLRACCCEVTPVSLCHIYYPPENLSSHQLDTSQGKDEQDQLSKPIPVRHFNRPDIHSTLVSVCSLLFCCVSIKILSLQRNGVHMSVCFYKTHSKLFSELKSFQPQRVEKTEVCSRLRPR